MLRIVILAPMLLAMTGCAKSQTGMRILCLGDSYTIGESVAASERWPVQLAEMLRAAGVEVADPVIIAHTGWTTDELSAAIDRENPRGPFDLVTLLIGVNDQYRGRSPEDFPRRFVELLKRSIALAGDRPSRVIVLSIPDWGVTPFAADRDRANIAAEIDQFNAICRDESQRAGITFIDVTPISRRAAGETNLVASDGLHPSGAMYRLWADLVAPAAKNALTPQSAR